MKYAASSGGNWMPEVTVVVRSVDERTTARCCQRVEAQVSSEHVHLIRVTPFFEAVRKTLEVGLEAGRKWTLALDADVLLHDEAIGQLVALAEEQPTDSFECQGRVLDKVYGGPRPGGPHLYRTSLIDKALTQMTGAEKDIRPETHVIKQMENLGHAWIQHRDIFGIHDYGQFYADLYRKAFVHAHKHRYDMRFLRPMWERLGQSDIDYQVLALGLNDGWDADSTSCVRLQDEMGKVRKELSDRGINEKPPMGPDECSDSFINGLISKGGTAPEYDAWQRGDLPPKTRHGLMQRIRRRAGRMFGVYR